MSGVDKRFVNKMDIVLDDVKDIMDLDSEKKELDGEGVVQLVSHGDRLYVFTSEREALWSSGCGILTRRFEKIGQTGFPLGKVHSFLLEVDRCEKIGVISC